MKRNRREHGRILSVETKIRGSALAADYAAGVTTISVADAGDFDEDGGWLYIGTQTVAYTACDDDTGVITLADALAEAAEQGDTVALWSDLYGEVVDYQEALVELDGEYDNLDVVVAEVAEGVGDLPEGDRGRAGESCTLLRVADDEWEIVGVGGRPRKSRGVRWEQDDYHTLTADDVTVGTMTMALTHRPIDEALTCVLAGVPQRPTEWTIDYDAQTLTMPLDGWEPAGAVIWVHYAYFKGVTTPSVSPQSWTIELDDDYAVAQPGLGPGGTAIVGTGAVWKDSDDATYVQVTGNYSGPGEPAFVGGASASVDPASASVTTPAVQVFIRARVSTPDTSGSGMPLPRFHLGPLPGNSGASFTVQPVGEAPASPAWIEVEIAGDTASLLAAPATYGASVYAPYYAAGTSPVVSGLRWWVHEMHIVVREVA